MKNIVLWIHDFGIEAHFTPLCLLFLHLRHLPSQSYRQWCWVWYLHGVVVLGEGVSSLSIWDLWVFLEGAGSKKEGAKNKSQQLPR